MIKVYKKLFSYLAGEKLNAYLAIILSAISAFFMVYGYYYIYLFFKSVIVSEDLENASLFSIKIVIFLTLSALLYLLSGLASHKLAFYLETILRKKGIDGLMDASFRFFDLNSSGYIRKTIDDNAAKTHTAVAHMLPDNAQAILIPIFILVLSFIVSFKVGVLIIVLTALGAFLLKGMMGNAKFMELFQASLDRLSSESVEYIRAMQVVKIFGTTLRSFKALHEAIMDYSKYAYDYTLTCKNAFVGFQLIFLALIPIIIIPLSFFLADISEPKELALELIMIFFLSGAMMVSFIKIMWMGMNIFNANYALDKLEAMYDKMQEDKLSFGKKEYFDSFDIEFENVSFAYSDEKVLENLSFTLEGKKTYALVGHSGSGKSTIAKLLSGFYKVDSGVIKIGGYALYEYTKKAIISNISFVFQDSKLFKKSIYLNVALADERAGKAEVMQALSLAGCDEFINKFKDKENTIIGSKGVYLSGGERQRIAIARAILKKAPIIIMDEASAAIDADNEYELQKAFKNLMKDKTVIMIAHRMTSIKNVDEILVLENGQVVQRGDHASLDKEKGPYSELLRLYKTANEWNIK